MIQFVTGPSWFSGYDIIFDIISVIVATLVMLSFYKIYKYTNDGKFMIFSLSFLLIAASEFAKVFRSSQVYYDILQSKTVGTLTIIVHQIHTGSLLIFCGNFISRTLFLLGLLGMFYTFNRTENRMPYYIIIYFILLTSLLSSQYYYVFHLTAAIFLLFIVRHGLINHSIKKNKASLLIAASFILLLISRIFFIFVAYDRVAYVFAEITQLAAFLTMLSIYTQISRNKKVNTQNKVITKTKKTSKNGKKK